MNKNLIWGVPATLLVVVVVGYFLFASAPEEKKESIKSTVQDIVSGDKESDKDTAESAKYKIEFTTLWSEENHPGNYIVRGAHFSPFVAYSHSSEEGSLIFQEGSFASAGIENMAETGGVDLLNQEIEGIIANSLAYQKAQGIKLDVPGTDVAELDFNQGNSILTFVSMIAPSPDWFVFALANLFQDGKWLEQIELSLTTYDAGTDNGKTFLSENSDTIPKNPVLLFPEFLQGMGKITLTRIN